jgi:OHS family lactose permease-like MFS transporter
MVASGLVEGPLLISITKLLHAVELPVLLVAIFKYNSLNFDKRSLPRCIWWALPAPAR